MNTSTNDYNRNPAEIRDEIEHQKSQLKDSFVEAKNSVSAEEVFIASQDYIVERSQNVYDTVSDFVRDNPVPVALTSVGIASLVLGGIQMKNRNRQSAQHYHIGENGKRYYRDLKNNAAHLQDSAKQKALQTQKSLTNTAGSAQHAIQDFAERRPVLTALMGITFGAIIGGAFPRTRVEDENVGPIRDRSFERAQESVGHLVSTAQDTASQFIEEERKAVKAELDKTRGQVKESKDDWPREHKK